jgi:DNA-directed RNA polymerase specialized sigma subunit
MSIPPISGQASQAAQTDSSSSTTAVTSNDPTSLSQQGEKIKSQISQLQNKHGSSQQIQKLKQQLNTVQAKLLQLSKTNVMLTYSKSSETHSVSKQIVKTEKTSNNVMDTKA